MISPSRSRSGSNCRASRSGISIVNCIDLKVARTASGVKPCGNSTERPTARMPAWGRMAQSPDVSGLRGITPPARSSTTAF
jgi:hypothetical protein